MSYLLHIILITMLLWPSSIVLGQSKKLNNLMKLTAFFASILNKNDSGAIPHLFYIDQCGLGGGKTLVFSVSRTKSNKRHRNLCAKTICCVTHQKLFDASAPIEVWCSYRKYTDIWKRVFAWQEPYSCR